MQMIECYTSCDLGIDVSWMIVNEQNFTGAETKSPDHVNNPWGETNYHDYRWVPLQNFPDTLDKQGTPTWQFQFYEYSCRFGHFLTRGISFT